MGRQPLETAASPDYHNYSKMITDSLVSLAIQFCAANSMSNKLNPAFVFWMKYFVVCVIHVWLMYQSGWWQPF